MRSDTTIQVTLGEAALAGKLQSKTEIHFPATLPAGLRMDLGAYHVAGTRFYEATLLSPEFAILATHIRMELIGDYLLRHQGETYVLHCVRSTQRVRA